MLNSAVRPTAEPSLLVVTSEGGESGAVAAAVNAAALRVTHALSLPSALATLAEGAFDCVLVDAGTAEVAAAEVVRAVRGRAGSAAVVAVHAAGTPPAALAEHADLVLDTADLAGDWLTGVQQAVERGHLRAALREAETSVARLTGIVDSVGDAVFTLGPDGLVTSWNAGAEALYGYPAAEMVGRDAAVLHLPGSDEHRRVLAMVVDGRPVRGLETVLRTRDGELAEVSLDAAPLRGRDGELVGVVVVGRDISHRRELEAELVRQTMHDVLTGLPNRSFLTYRLTQALAAARRRRDPVAVLVVDLDQFKAIDDLHGHLAGDRVLGEVADRLRSLARPTDVVARVGGDEFVLVCPDTDLEAARGVADEVMQALGTPFDVDGRGLRIAASIGIAVSPPLDTDADTLLQHADAAMYEAKARGRARSQVFDPTFVRRAGEQRRLAAELHAALAQERLDVHYQPVVDLATDRLVGLEALARWHHPIRGAVPPGTFVPLAEAHGFVAELDRWVLTRACRETAERLASGQLPPNARVAVNLSARSLDDPGLVGLVGAITRRSGLPPEALVLEITETAVLHNRAAARATLQGLRELGAGVSLDDFGTGYSSLSFLRELPVTVVKIDRSFVRDAVERPEDLAIAQAIVGLAHGLGLETVAEGIETVEQRDLLHRMGCASAQGFWWSPAVPMADVPGLRPARTIDRPAAPRPRIAGPRRRVPETAPVRRHRTACCLRGGFDAGQAWLVVASTARREAFARSLGPLHADAVARGQLVELDAYDTLRRVSGADGRLDPTRFDHVVGAALRRLGAASQDVGVHAELGHVTQPLLSLEVSSDLRRRLHAVSNLSLAYGDHPADCAAHGSLPVGQLAVDDSTAS